MTTMWGWEKGGCGGTGVHVINTQYKPKQTVWVHVWYLAFPRRCQRSMSCVFLWRQGNKALLLVTLRRDFTLALASHQTLIWVLAGQRAPRICQSAPPGLWLQELHPYYIFYMVLGIWTWVLCLHRKHSCTLKHLSQAHCMNFFF